MHHYAQVWSERASTWLVEGDQHQSFDDALKEVGRMRERHPDLPDDHFRVTSYLTPLTQENEAMRLAR